MKNNTTILIVIALILGSAFASNIWQFIKEQDIDKITIAFLLLLEYMLIWVFLKFSTKKSEFTKELINQNFDLIEKLAEYEIAEAKRKLNNKLLNNTLTDEEFKQQVDEAAGRAQQHISKLIPNFEPKHKPKK